MRLVVSLGNKRVTVRLPDQDCRLLFDRLTGMVLHYEPMEWTPEQAAKEEPEDPPEEDPPPKEEANEEMEIKIIPRQEKAFVPKDPPQPKGYSGFFYTRCPWCGDERGFCTKYPITEVTCKKCGRKFRLPKKPRTLSFRCECGKSYRYLTNIEDEMFDIPCMECDALNAVILNHKTGVYEDAETSNCHGKRNH